MKLESLSSRAADRGMASAVARVRAGGVRLLIERYGKPQAALISISDLELLERADTVLASREGPQPSRVGGYDFNAVMQLLETR